MDQQQKPAQQPQQKPVKSRKIKQARQEMWWIILAKSKTLRFFAVSCEFILFLGGLWITFTVNDPESKTWLAGNINMIFLTIMGWAVDAAMPEAWLHVVIQHVQKERGQLGWSKFVAICISVLFIGNIVYSVFTGGDTSGGVSGTPANATGWILLVLVILRISVGFVYITVRQCQEWIKRQNPDLATPPALSNLDSWSLVALAAHMQSSFQQQLTELASAQKTALIGLVDEKRLAEVFDLQLQKWNLVDLQVQRLFSEVQELQFDASQPPDYDALTQIVLTKLQAQFDAQKRGQVASIQEEMTQQIDAPKPRQKRASSARNDAASFLRQTSASKTDKKASIQALLAQNMGLTSYYLASEVGCSEATARRIKREYLTMRQAQNDASENDA